MKIEGVSRLGLACILAGAFAIAAGIIYSARAAQGAEVKSAAAAGSKAPGAPSQQAEPIKFPKIDRKPRIGRVEPKVLDSIPKYSREPRQDDAFAVDLRGADLSTLDLRQSGKDLAYAVFDTKTVWPRADRMSEGFDPKVILDLGKNPGLGVRSLHERGITGKGVGIAIIDFPLLVGHVEYADRLRLYEELNVMPNMTSSMHGTAVASIAVGRTSGVAPEAYLYFIGNYPVDLASATKRQSGDAMPKRDFHTLTEALRRILAVNKQLPEGQKIRAVSMSIGWSPDEGGYSEMVAAVDDAKKDGLFVSSSSIEDTYGIGYHGLGRPPMADPELFESYEPGLFWAHVFPGPSAVGRIMVPMDSRTTASHTGNSDYAFWREGGWSWVSPYLAGVYALACQAKPEITPEEFLALAKKTGHTVDISWNGQPTQFGPIIDPVAIIKALETGPEKPVAPLKSTVKK